MFKLSQGNYHMTKGVRITNHREDSQSLLWACNRDGNPLQYWPGKSHGWKNVVCYSPWGCKNDQLTLLLSFLVAENKPDPYWIYSSTLNFVLDWLCLVMLTLHLCKGMYLWLKINIIALSQKFCCPGLTFKGVVLFIHIEIKSCQTKRITCVLVVVYG